MRAQIFGKLFAVMLGVIGLVSGSAFAAVGQLYDAAGEVKTALGSQMAQAAGKGASLENDMIVSTGDKSQAVLKFEDGQVIALQSNTSFRIHDYRYDPREVEKSNMFFSMLKGGLRAITGLIGSKHQAAFKLQTPNATIGIRGTDFMVVMNNQMYSNVVSGSISMTNAAGTAVFSAGQAAVVASATALPVSISAAALPAGTFSQLGAIPVPVPAPAAPGAGPGSVPSGGAGSGAGAGTGTTASTGTATGGTAAGSGTAATGTAAGSTAAGSAAAGASAATGAAIGGVTVGTISAVAVAVAAVATVVSSNNTTGTTGTTGTR